MIRMIATAFGLYTARMAFTLPFLNSDGRLVLPAGATHLPASAEYFFSSLMFAMTGATLIGSVLLFGRGQTGGALAPGARTAGCFLAVFIGLDLLLDFAVAHRGLSLWLRNVALDYTPLVMIPLALGWLLDRQSKEPRP